jgi:hypothetical protein
MIELLAPQGSPEWLAGRAGVCTASMYETALARTGGLDERQAAYVALVRSGMAPQLAAEAAGFKAMPRAQAVQDAIAGLPTGDWTDGARDYAFRLSIERRSKQPLDDGVETYWTRRGHELEQEAIEAYEDRTGNLVRRVGLVLTDDRRFGASADGLVARDGGVEVKCWVDAAKLRKVLLDRNSAAVRRQCLGGMWVTGRKWWDFVLYCPALAVCGLDMTVIRINRDDDEINRMELDLLRFDRLVDEYGQRIDAMAQEQATA